VGRLVGLLRGDQGGDAEVDPSGPDRHDHDRRRDLGGADRRALGPRGERPPRLGGEQHDVVGCGDGGAGGVAVGSPGRRGNAVERLERRPPGGHVGEGAQPDEPIGVVEVAEAAEDLHSQLLLRLDEVGLEELDEAVPGAGMERVLAQLDDHEVTIAHPDRFSDGGL
jgi:hypothetical protein